MAENGVQFLNLDGDELYLDMLFHRKCDESEATEEFFLDSPQRPQKANQFRTGAKRTEGLSKPELKPYVYRRLFKPESPTPSAPLRENMKRKAEQGKKSQEKATKKRLFESQQ